MRCAFRLLLLFGLAAIAAPAFAQEPTTPPAEAEKKAVVIPFELLKTRHMAIQVKLNGKGPYRLIFDTGAPFNVINNRIAKDSGVLGAKAQKPALGMFGMMGQQMAKTLEVGDAKLEGVPVMVMDHPTVGMISQLLGPIDGIVGFPFFARYQMTIDYQKKEMTLVPNGYKPSDFMEGMMAKMMEMQEQKDPRVVGSAGVWGFEVDRGKDETEAGVTVKKVLAGSAAESAGIKAGDRVLTIDGRWTDSVGDAFAAAAAVKPGKEVVVVVLRDKKELKLAAKPGKGI